jgi:hypothetical protein
MFNCHEMDEILSRAVYCGSTFDACDPLGKVPTLVSAATGGNQRLSGITRRQANVDCYWSSVHLFEKLNSIALPRKG